MAKHSAVKDHVEGLILWKNSKLVEITSGQGGSGSSTYFETMFLAATTYSACFVIFSRTPMQARVINSDDPP